MNIALLRRLSGDRSVSARLTRWKLLTVKQRKSVLRGYALRIVHFTTRFVQPMVNLAFAAAQPLFKCGPFRSAEFLAAAKKQRYLLAELGHSQLLVHCVDEVLSRDVFAHRNSEFVKVERAFKVIKSNSFEIETLIDVGANLGNICIPARARGFIKRGVAIEPEPRNFRLLRANVLLNDFEDSIELHNVALGRGDADTLELTLSGTNLGDHRIIDGERRRGTALENRTSQQVRATTLDKLLGKADLSSSLVWMDTQGYEGAILQAAKTLLAQRPPMVLEFWPFGMEWTGCYAELRDAIQCYPCWYDLSEAEPQRERMSIESIEALYSRLARNGEYGACDLLLLTR